MPTAESCRERAAESERLARLVSYERDRVRLLSQAQEWRDRADLIEATPPEPDPQPAPALLERVRGWLRPPKG